MKKILGLDLGVSSIGWAMVNEAENKDEKSSIIRLGVRVNPLTTDEQSNYEKGKSITTASDRTLKRSMRRNLQRYKLRREKLIKILKEQGFINDDTILSEEGNFSTFQTFRLRAKAASEEISLEELSKVLLMINKKRGYKSSRKAQSAEEGEQVDGLDAACRLRDEKLTPAELCLKLVEEGKKQMPDFFRSDLLHELEAIYSFQAQFYPEILTEEFRNIINNKSSKETSKRFLAIHNIYTATVEGRGLERNIKICNLRAKALKEKLNEEEMALVICEVNGQVNNSSGYLGAIGDRGKELEFNHLTIGQYQMAMLEKNPNTSLKNMVFYRQDYLNEFETIWTTQSQFHPELTDDLKKEIRDTIIFYQRPLKSQKGLISFCEFESRKIEVMVDGKKKTKLTGPRVCPKSSPLFQEFRIWQNLNNLRATKGNETFELDIEAKRLLFAELMYCESLSKAEAGKILFKTPREYNLNFEKLEGNRLMSKLLEAGLKVVELSGNGDEKVLKLKGSKALQMVKEVFEGLGYETNWLEFDASKTGAELDREPLYRLWHLIYSYEGDNSKSGDKSLVEKLAQMLHMENEMEYAKIFAKVAFEQDYGSLSAKAIQKILPYLQEGNRYDVACDLAGYRHSKDSLTREEIDNKVLKEKLEILPKNSLRNPVVEKILNQMVHVVNEVIDLYGKPDEVRIELARELKKSAKERAEATASISANTKENEKIVDEIKKEFGFSHVSRNDVIRYKLWKELAENGYKALYSNEYIPKEKIFTKEVDIEHIIPQARLFDDSFGNKTLEYRSYNLEKSSETAADYVRGKFGEEGYEQYLNRVKYLFDKKAISKTKYRYLTMKQSEIPEGFINRDLRDSQYISKKAQEMLKEVVREVLATTGSVTDRLREDWQLVDVMMELNWEKYQKQGLTEESTGRDGQRIRKIKDWTKRNDHRHHAMDALTIAFTRRQFIQYLNTLNATIENRMAHKVEEYMELYKADHKLIFTPPMPLDELREETKLHLEKILVSIKAKNKVATPNVNKTRGKGKLHRKIQLTPRGELHKETVYGTMKQAVVEEVKVDGKLTKERILMVTNALIREALLERLEANGGDSKKAFTGKNSREKSPIWLNELHTQQVPEKVKIKYYETVFTIRKPVSKDLNLSKVADARIKQILENRLAEYGNDANKAFSNLEENPIWLNKEKGLQIKSVTIIESIPGIPLHEKRDKNGNLILDKNGNKQPSDFVNLKSNHHVAIFLDEKGELQEHIVSFMETTARALQQIPIVDKEYNKDKGWQFLFSMKQNEYFVFPNPATGFNPNEVDLMNEENYPMISPNLFRVQKLSSKYYVFRHHLETSVEDNNALRDITWKRITNLSLLVNVVKVRIDHSGKIVAVGEY